MLLHRCSVTLIFYGWNSLRIGNSGQEQSAEEEEEEEEGGDRRRMYLPDMTLRNLEVFQTLVPR